MNGAIKYQLYHKIETPKNKLLLLDKTVASFMLSVLIPTYNYNIFPLTKEVHGFLISEKIVFEIICLDDGSGNKNSNLENEKINSLPHATFAELPQNIGRSAIRNLLAEKASYDWLLFLDADVFPKQKKFISSYLNFLNSNHDIIYGGIEYQAETPEPDKILRWKYGKEREAVNANRRNKDPYIHFLTLNFLIQKNVFEKVTFNEEIPNLRHEDTLFSYNLKEENVRIIHIDNPVYHLGLENSEIFLQKSIESVEGANFLQQNELIDSKYIKILHFQKKINRLKLSQFILAFGKMFEKKIRKNLLGANPNLKLFDFYRLYHLLKIQNG